MRRDAPFLTRWTLACGLALCAVGTEARAFAQGPVKQAPPGEVQSDVERGDVPYAALQPLSIEDGSVRPTAEKIPLSRGVFLLADSDAVAHPSHTSLLPIGSRGRKIPVQTVEVERGRVAVDLPKTGRMGVLLRGPDGLSAIATQGRVAMVVEQAKVHIVTFGQDVLLGKDGRFQTIPSHSVIRYDRTTGAIGSPVALPAAPTLRAPSSIAPALSGPTELWVQADSGSHPVRLGVFDEQGNQVGESMLVESARAFPVSLPAAGTYRVIARALDESGVGGPIGAPLLLRVLGVAGELRRERGAFLMTPDQRVPLLGAHGLQMYHESTKRFVPAPASIGLVGGERTVLLFRDPSSPTGIVSLRLEPLVAEARVRLSPGLAVWPQHPIVMSVVARDAHGEPIVLGENFEVKVRVNFDEVDVHWEARDGGVHATLAPQSGPGPWVVRVSVIDEYGTEVGRNHLEVICGRPAPVRHASR